MPLRNEEVTGRKRKTCHIAVVIMGNLLAVVVHAANIHNTKSWIRVAKRAHKSYLGLKIFCADARYKVTFVKELGEMQEEVVVAVGSGADSVLAEWLTPSQQ